MVNATTPNILRTKTNSGDKAKIVSFLLYDTTGAMEEAIVIRKMILTSKPWEYQGFKKLKYFKDKCLMLQDISLKVSTFKEVAKILDV